MRMRKHIHGIQLKNSTFYGSDLFFFVFFISSRYLLLITLYLLKNPFFTLRLNIVFLVFA